MANKKKSDITWAVAARHLYSIDPRRYNIAALARIFGKNAGTMWWAIHPDLQRDHERDRQARRRIRLAEHRREHIRRKERHDAEAQQNLAPAP